MIDRSFPARLAWVLWPSFITAAGAVGFFYTVFDPQELYLFGRPAEISRQAAYSVGFLLFWLLGASSSALTVFLSGSPFERDRCPLRPTDRPDGCPKQCPPPIDPRFDRGEPMIHIE
jgi:hypothetical protein